MFSVFHLIRRYLYGVAAQFLHEASWALKEFGGEGPVFSRRLTRKRNLNDMRYAITSYSILFPSGKNTRENLDKKRLLPAESG